MKKNFIKLALLTACVSITSISCTIDINDGLTDNNHLTPGTNVDILDGTGTLAGTITKDILIKKGNYTLDGIVKVAAGVTLTIEAGATFTVSTNKTSSLVILQDARINAQGTANEPIVFTTNTKTPGDWGGITIYGKAPIKAINGNTTALSEDGNNVIYGGTDANSNSGIMKFVRVEYAGKKIGDGTSETNSMTFYAVGAGTILENLVAYKGTDDGFEFFGGTVSATQLVSYGNYDDSFDWQDAWSGQNNNNWFALQTGIANFGMEIEASSNAENTPPKINTITLIRKANTTPEVAGSSEISAIQFKKHGSGIFSNVYVDGYKNLGGQKAYAVLIQDAATDASQVLGNKIQLNTLNYQNSDNPGVWGYAFAQSQPKTFSNTTAVTKASIVSGAWAIVDGIDLLEALQ